MLKVGLYEQLLNSALKEYIDMNKDNISAQIEPIDPEEAAKMLSVYIADFIEKQLVQVEGSTTDRLKNQVALANSFIVRLKNTDVFEQDLLEKEGLCLLSVQENNNIQAITNNVPKTRPITPLSTASLFTGAEHEPEMVSELKKEIVSSDRIDILVSFIKWTGLRLIFNELKEFTNNGGKLRVITTSYMGATDPKALAELASLSNTQIKVSYDTKRTRLHAKSYIFKRNTGFTTAYVGSSNLSNVAITSGLEWNIKATVKDTPHVLKKIEATFESYWNNMQEFDVYTTANGNKFELAILKERKQTKSEFNDFIFDINPYPYQQEILDKLQAERQIRGYYRNLLVSATGTGKTIISALDFKRFYYSNNKNVKLLFVAHRKEILEQSIRCFRTVLKDNNFGDISVADYKPTSTEHLFVSIQTFNSKDMSNKIDLSQYDFVIIDEFHRAGADWYNKLLTEINPKILLGLTATPERMDGKNILKYFDGRIAAEIRLPEAIERKLLAPFQYFGVTDAVDLSGLRWSRGGYDRTELSNIYTLDLVRAENRAGLVVQKLLEYVTDISEVRGIGFCVSKEHAKFMSEFFNKHGIISIYLTSESDDETRNKAKGKLENKEIKFIFVVDLYNEGVDIPSINTVLFLRPTESLTVFLQQLGRGLRLSSETNKECLTVLDFIGQAHKNYSFESKFAALLKVTNKDIQKEINNGFPSVPKGCYIQLEKYAQKYILDNIKRAINNKAELVEKLKRFHAESEQPLTLSNFLGFYNLDIKAVYKNDSFFTALCVEAGLKNEVIIEADRKIAKSFSKVTYIDSRRWIQFLIAKLPNLDLEYIEKLDEESLKMLKMFYYTLWQDNPADFNWKKMSQLLNSKMLMAELLEILRYQYSKIDFIDKKIDMGYSCPIDLHCSYSRDQILAAVGYAKSFNSIRQGVVYVAEQKVDLFFITLNKSEKEYSPSTLYDDYSISESLFHWQSQSTTSEASDTGQRYQTHKATGNKILLFVREYKKGAPPYTFLGMADYVSHEGSAPMNIIWRLHEPIPAKYLKQTNKLMSV